MTPHRPAQSVPGYYLVLALSVGVIPADIAARVQQLLAQQGMSLDDLAKPERRVPVAVLEAGLRAILPEPGAAAALALRAGEQNRLTSQGSSLSVLIMTSATLRDALQLGRFMPMISTALTLNYEETAGAGYLFIQPKTGSGLMDEIIALYVAAALERLGVSLAGRALGVQVMIAGPCPAPLAQDPGLAHWRFEAPVNCLIIPAESLRAVSLFADPVAHQLALRACERELLAQQPEPDLSQRIQHLLDAGEMARDQQTIAAALHLSRSTLKRQLGQQGLTFSEVLQDWRLQKATRLLLGSRLSLAEIAQQLGYSDQANFAHAFKAWTGRSPSAWRSL